MFLMLTSNSTNSPLTTIGLGMVKAALTVLKFENVTGVTRICNEVILLKSENFDWNSVKSNVCVTVLCSDVNLPAISVRSIA